MTAEATQFAPGPNVEGGRGEFAELMLQGLLHVYVAFDWGDEIDLKRARKLAAPFT